MNEIKQLAAAIMLQAAKDYFNTSENGKKVIINDLRSEWMLFLTDGQSEIISEKLLSDPEGIKTRIKIVRELRNEVLFNV